MNFYEFLGIDLAIASGIFALFFGISVACILSFWFGGLTLGPIPIPASSKKVQTFGIVVFIIMVFSILPIFSKTEKTFTFKIDNVSIQEAVKYVNGKVLDNNIIYDYGIDSIETRNFDLYIEGKTVQEIVQVICDNAQVEDLITFEESNGTILIKVKD